MRYYLFFIIGFVCFSCSNGEKKQEEINEVRVEKRIDEQIEDAVVEKEIEIPVLPFFDLQFKDDDFEKFYYELVKNCAEKDTVKVLKAIHDTLRFSKYECAYGQFIQSANCDNCVRCTKKGMMQGVFSGSTLEGVCERLFDLITKFGVGKFSDNEYYSKYMPIPNAYANFHFVQDSMYAKYFNYEAILPLHNEVVIKTEISDVAPTVGYLPFQPINYSNEPGMGQYDENTEINWLEYGEGYISSQDILTGFDYTLVIFEKTNQGWKITGFFQPPGC